MRARARPAARAPGTTVAVRDLFFNTPARRKFLKSAGRRAALGAAHARGLRARVSARRVPLRGRRRGRASRWPAAASAARPPGRALRRAPRRAADRGARGAAGFTFEAWLGVPEHARVTREGQVMLVNRRWIQSPLLSQALRQGYGNLIPPGPPPDRDRRARDRPGDARRQHPPDQARGPLLARGRGVRLRRADAWRSRSAMLAPRYVPSANAPGPAPLADAHARARRARTRAVRPGSAARPARSCASSPAARTLGRRHRRGGRRAGALRLVAARRSGRGRPSRPCPRRRRRCACPTCGSSTTPTSWRPIPGGLLIVDQHAAHERILYEEALDALRTGAAATSQGLLFSLLVDLSRDEFDLLLESRAGARALGFELEALVAAHGRGARRPRRTSARRDPATLLRDVLDGMGEHHGRSRAKDEPWRSGRQVVRLPRRGARRASTLSREEMNHLIDRLFATDLPHGDPHGRATYVRVDLDELNRRFGRTLSADGRLPFVLPGATGDRQDARSRSSSPSACGGEIVCADSRQIYRGPRRRQPASRRAAERARVPHHRFDVLDPRETTIRAATTRGERAAAREASPRAGAPALLVGGTGLYLRALHAGLAEVPEVPEDVRARVRERLSGDGLRRAPRGARPARSRALARAARARATGSGSRAALEVRARDRARARRLAGRRSASEPETWFWVALARPRADLTEVAGEARQRLLRRRARRGGADAARRRRAARGAGLRRARLREALGRPRRHAHARGGGRDRSTRHTAPVRQAPGDVVARRGAARRDRSPRVRPARVAGAGRARARGKIRAETRARSASRRGRRARVSR